MDGYLVLATSEDGNKVDLCSIILTSSGEPALGFQSDGAAVVRLEAERALWLSLATRDALRGAIQSGAVRISGYEQLLFTHQSAVVEKTLQCAEFLKAALQGQAQADD